MDFSTQKMCPRAQMPESGLRMFAQTLPALPVRQEWPVREVLAGAEGSYAEDWGYIRQLADGESPFCVRPVTGSHLFGSSIGRVLGLRQPHLPFRHQSWTILVDLRFSCLLFWWGTMSARTDLPVLDQADAAAAAANPLRARL